MQHQSELSTQAVCIGGEPGWQVLRADGCHLLELLGQLAANGHEAIDAVARQRYDIVLMDVQMPVMDGLETTRQLRMIEQFAALPVIAMTANVMATDREQCFAAGMNDFMSKPVRLQELREKLLHWLKA